MSNDLESTGKPHIKPKVLPLAYWLVALLTMVLLYYVLPIVQFTASSLSYLGVVFVIVGIAVTAMSAGAFVRAGTPLLPFSKSTAVVTTGLYRHTRNPMYLGMVIVLVGSALLLGSIGSFLPIPVFAGIIHYRFIRHEEKFLEQLFGDEYLAYKYQVRRWV